MTGRLRVRGIGLDDFYMEHLTYNVTLHDIRAILSSIAYIEYDYRAWPRQHKLHLRKSSSSSSSSSSTAWTSSSLASAALILQYKSRTLHGCSATIRECGLLLSP